MKQKKHKKCKGDFVQYNIAANKEEIVIGSATYPTSMTMAEIAKERGDMFHAPGAYGKQTLWRHVSGEDVDTSIKVATVPASEFWGGHPPIKPHVNG